MAKSKQANIVTTEKNWCCKARETGGKMLHVAWIGIQYAVTFGAALVLIIGAIWGFYGFLAKVTAHQSTETYDCVRADGIIQVGDFVKENAAYDQTLSDLGPVFGKVTALQDRGVGAHALATVQELNGSNHIDVAWLDRLSCEPHDLHFGGAQ